MAFINRLTEPYRLSLEHSYNQFISNNFKDEQTSVAIIGTIITVGLYWALGSLYTIVDVTQKPKFLLRYKIQPNSKTSPVSRGVVHKIVKQVVWNQLLAIIFGYWLISVKYRFFSVQQHIPTLGRFVLEWAVFVLTREITFYYTHRALHENPVLFKHIHKRHHEWSSPIAIGAIYCHPIEHLISNVFPLMIGPLLMQSHSLTMYLWMIYLIFLTLNDHCGYHFPLNPSPPVYHDFHHLKCSVNYGVLGLLDWLHGTDKPFRASKYYKFQQVYFTITPPVDLIYEENCIKRK